MRGFIILVLLRGFIGTARADQAADLEMQLTTMMMQAYNNLLIGKDDEAVDLLKKATRKGHPEAPLVLSELTWLKLRGARCNKETLN